MSHNPSSAQQSASVIIGASGGIGDALVRRYLALGDCETVFAVSRTSQTSSVALSGTRLRWLLCDSSGEDVKRVVEELVSSGLNLRRIIICTGLLHNEDITPEKSLDKLDPDAMRAVFDVNLVIPALWLAALVKPLRRTEGSVIAVLSARVGSIADNRLGGWYSYRASKAALNMFLKSAAIEYSRRSPGVKLVSFHPGTTDTYLSSPFQANVSEEALFTPDFVADRLVKLLDEVQPDGQLSFLDWAGIEIPW
jgi:NAD(P)-dependent dehydrogenase (short-subunit alcohol dehydrogenase family)|tara:strand:- start:185 stop:940 length:756 start_codon:yes stop_codon:yes gene_type:complete